LIQIIASFSVFTISQDSVATHLMYVGISINNFIASFLLNMSVKYYENRAIFSKDMDKSVVSPFFDSRCRSPEQVVSELWGVTHLPYRITFTQYYLYLPPDTSELPRPTPARQAGTRFTYVYLEFTPEGWKAKLT